MDTFKIINDFLTFNGRLEKQPFIRRYLIVYLLKFAGRVLAQYLSMPWLAAATAVFIIPQMSLAVRRCHDIGLSWPKTILVLVGLTVPIADLIALIYLCWAKSDPHYNQFG